MRRRRVFFDDTPDDEETNLTPLIDVVFVVLILFILVAPMVEVDKIQLAGAPERVEADAITPGNLTIHVRADNTIWINKQLVSPEHLRPLLTALRSSEAPQLYQDQNASFGTYQLVKNAVEEAGFSELDVVLEPKK